ncbi:MAG: TetR/AcrR family transcriptional regulator [Lachnospiraceae bacterium]|nr:TetR/AcrR family transcriptional regulator [Lachnospiraceae bacterium]
MAKADHSIDPRILESARQEFLKLGFEKASLKTICEKAQVTTGALYKRYKGKEELFCAVVADTVADLNEVLQVKSSVKLDALPDEELIQAWDMDEGYMNWWFQYLYDRHDGFVLLLTCAEGTCYSHFQHDWVEKMTESTYAYYREAYRRGLSAVNISQEEMHILLTAFWATIYEPFIHGYNWEQLQEHCRLVCRMFDWHGVLGFSPVK